MNRTGLFASIRTKIAAAFFVVFVLITSVTSVLLYLFIKDTLHSGYINSLISETERILDDTDYQPTQIPITDNDQWIYVWYESEVSQQMLYQKPGFPEDGIEEIFSLTPQPLDSIYSYGPINFFLDTMAYVIMDKHLQNPESGKIRLVLAKSNQVLIKQLSTVKMNMIVANVMAIVLSIILSLVVSRYSLRPINAIISQANRIKASTKMERLPVSKSGDEVAQLSTTINEMIDRIESTINTQNTFFASAAHELRTPLANMQSELEYRISISKNPELSQSWESLRDEVIRLKNVVQDFLLVSQLKNESLELRKTPVRMDDVIYDVLEKLKPTLRKSSIEINLQLTNNLEPQQIDIDKMESLLVNLIDNAQRYGDNSLPLTISLKFKSGQTILQIQNKMADKPSKSSGNGLGLWICKKIADLHEFHFKTYIKDQLFIATLTIPNKVRNRPN